MIFYILTAKILVEVKNRSYNKRPQLLNTMSEVFITGYSGRFPDAANIVELKDKLLQKQDLVSQSKRYPSVISKIYIFN